MSFYTDKSYSVCKNEQQFKMLWIKKDKILGAKGYFFCVETEETVKGFPDVIQVASGDSGNTICFKEFKYANKSGKIHFEPTQPAFYKKHPDLDIKVVAYNPKSKRVHIFPAHFILEKGGLFAIDEKAELDLNKVESMFE